MGRGEEGEADGGERGERGAAVPLHARLAHVAADHLVDGQ